MPVVLLEADLEQPSLAEDLGLPNRGLTEYLQGHLALDDLAQSTTLPDLHVIVAGECEVPAMQVLRSERLGNLIKLLSHQAVAIVVDLPPMAATGEAARVIGQIDRVLMVVEAGSTPAKLVKSALELIPAEKLVGVLLNRTKPAFGFFHWLKGLFR
jgi:non-specific protein-tyrosine kinase